MIRDRSTGEKPSSGKPAYTALSIIPERRILDREVISSLATQFWSQPFTSTQDVDASTVAAPGTAPMPLLRPSGISRPQLLVTTQALTKLPFIPSYSKDQGGVVLDTALVHMGGKRWWHTTCGRIRTQKFCGDRKQKGFRKTVMDPSNYALTANTKINLGRHTQFRKKTNFEPKLGLRRGFSSASVLRRKLGGSELRMEFAVNQVHYKASTSEESGYFQATPLTASLDISTAPRNPSAVQYRLGLYHARSANPGKKVEDSNYWQGLDSVFHVQGALAAHGGLTVWQGSPWKAKTTSQPSATESAPASAVEESEINKADQVKAKLAENTRSINRLRQEVQDMTCWVTSGGFTGQARDGKKGQGRGRAPWSAILPPPHLKFRAMMGVLANHPMGSSRGSVVEGSTAQTVTGAANSSVGGKEGQSWFVYKPLAWLQRQGEEMQKDWSIRPFASAGGSLQIGSFRRRILDFSRLVAKVDVGLPRGDQVGVLPAFSMREPATWNALTLSCSQQIFGPLRACADFRYTLDASEKLELVGVKQPKEQAQALWKHVHSMKPTKLESVLGLDLGVPMTSGFARIVAWYSPTKKEGMLEMRLF